MVTDYCTCAHIKKEFALQAAKVAQSLPHDLSLACVQCSVRGDYAALLEHSKKTRHSLAVKRISDSPEIFCLKCKDFQYHSKFDEITRPRKRKASLICNPTGIVNMGSTCFLSSILQLLLTNPFLVRFFALSQLFVPKCKSCPDAYETPPRHCMFCEMQKLYLISSRPNRSGRSGRITPASLLYTVWSTSRHLAYYEQQDAHELLIALLDTLGDHLHVNHGDFNVASVETIADSGVASQTSGSEVLGTGNNELTTGTPRGDGDDNNDDGTRPGSLQFMFRGIVNEVFSGVLKSELTCSTCGHRWSKYEPFRDLSLGIEKRPPAWTPHSTQISEGRMGESSFEGLPGSGGGRCGRTGSSTASSSTGDLDCTDASTMTTASSPQFEDDQVHLSDCLATFTAAETLQQDMQCAHCRVLCGVSKRLTVQVPPNCLLIHLKRFHVYSPGATSLECNKVDTMVHFPTRDLDLSPFLSSDLLDVMSGNNGPQEKDCSSPLFGDGETPLKESSSDLGNTDCDSVESSRGGSATRSILTNRAGSKKSSTSRSDFARLPTEATSGRDSESSSSGKLSAMSSQLAGGCGHVAIADGTAPSLLYDLEGVVCHIGPSLTQGHYISYVRKPSNGTCIESESEFPSNEWMKCDDESVSEVDEAEVIGVQGYILMYIRKDAVANRGSSV